MHGGTPCRVPHRAHPSSRLPRDQSAPYLCLQAAHPHLSILNLSSWQNQVLGLGSRSHADRELEPGEGLVGRPASRVHWLEKQETETEIPPIDHLLRPLGLMFLPPYQNLNKRHDNTFLIPFMENGILGGQKWAGVPFPYSLLICNVVGLQGQTSLGEYRLHTGLAGSCCRLGPHTSSSFWPRGSHGRKRASGELTLSPASAASWFCVPGQTLPHSGAQLPRITRKAGFDSDLGQPTSSAWRRAPSLTLHSPPLSPQLLSIPKGQLAPSTLQRS